ncbi:MAG: sensor histidine kinase, partial [Methanobacterium sp.]
SVEKEGRTKMSSEEYATRFIPPEESYLVAEEINKVLKTDDPNYFTNIEHSIIRTDGEKRYILVRLGVVQDDKGQTIKTYGVNQDITERKKAEEKIKASLKEKELLLREVHHRVKNNMQIISSLLNLQSQYLHDKADLELFIESQNRVKSMALVHERLYQSESLVRINFKDYIINLFGNLMHTYGRSINLKQNIKDIYLNIETAIPCGLIINELVTNAVKHAFPGQNNELICIELVKADNKLKLVVSDNGIGLPDDFNLDNNDSWGLQLVQMLVDQLNGEIRANSVNGAVFTILFNELNYKKRF